MITASPASSFPITIAIALAFVACGDAPDDVAAADASDVTDAASTDTADGADASPPTDTGTADADAPDVLDDTPRWHVVHQDLPAAFLSVWGRDPGDVWLAGADRGDGTGPWVVHGDASGWERVDLRAVDPAGGTMWWVYGPDASSVWLAGDFGRVFRWDRATETVAAIPTGTDATLYGIWGADDSLMWAVGGYVAPRSGPPVIVRIEDGVGAPLAELPEALGDDVTLFKVWGTASDDVWVIGEAGTVMRWDGAVWTHETLPGAPRLVTIHGDGAHDIAIVGGAAQAVVLECDGDAWIDLSPAGYPLLNGVSVGPDGDAFAAGLLGTSFRREGGAWTFESGMPVTKDWHGVWIDGRGDVWTAGGNLLSAAQLDAGAVLRWGPPRDDVPSGAVRGLEPPAHAEEEAVAEPADVVEPAPDVAEPEPEVVDPVDVEVVDDVGDGTIADVLDADVADAADDAGDTWVADATDVDVADDAGDTWVSDVVDADVAGDADGTGEACDVAPVEDVSVAPSPLIIGARQAPHDPHSFVPFVPGQAVEITHGPQGGIHIEVSLRVTVDSQAAVLELPIALYTRINGAIVGSYTSPRAPTPRLADGVYQTYTLSVIFWTDEPDPYACKAAVVDARVTLPGGEVVQVELPVTLVESL